MHEDVVTDLKQRIDKTLEDLKRDLSKVRTGRASTSVLEGIRVDYYGTPTPLTGVAARIAENMESSRDIPTATSVRFVPAKLLEENRAVINRFLQGGRGGKVSFTHLIGWAVVRALEAVPVMQRSFARREGKPVARVPDAVHLDIAVDVTLTADIPAWRPRTGHLYFGPQGEHEFNWLPAVPWGGPLPLHPNGRPQGPLPNPAPLPPLRVTSSHSQKIYYAPG